MKADAIKYESGKIDRRDNRMNVDILNKKIILNARCTRTWKLMKIMKFGGTSVGKPERMHEVAKLITKDDEPKIVQIARDYLERAGYAVVPAYDGIAALDSVRAEKPDLVVLDLGLEPFATRVKHYWFWNPTKLGISWYGAPWVNFLGWAITAAVVIYG